MNKQEFDAVAELAMVKAERAEMKKVKLLKSSRLNPFRGELLKLRIEGASYGDMAHWLKVKKACPVSRTTIMRFIKNNCG